MTRFPDHLLLRDARTQFFAAHQATFGKDGGYGNKWVRIEFGPLPVYFPNSAGRDRAVRLHDLHHIVTHYDVDLTGEAEIGAWEVASGCGSFWHAWYLNMGAVALGLLIAPRRIFQAFVRGRRTDNLYHHYPRLDDALLDNTVGQLRQRLRLDDPPATPTWRDHVAFAWWTFLSMLVAAMFPAIALACTAGLVLLAIWMLR